MKQKHQPKNEETKQEETSPEQLKQALEAKTQQLEDYTNTLRHLQADFENYIKRSEKEKQDLSAYANAKLLLKVLNLIDDFERALHTDADKDTLLQGLGMIHTEAHKLLAEEGVKPIKAHGETFDPYKHEIIDFQEGEKDGIILEELQKGYMMKDKVLRPSRVRVSKQKGDTNVQASQQ